MELMLIFFFFLAFRLGAMVEPPKVVRQLDWVDRFWPHDEERCVFVIFLCQG